jgi:hypothetical protein
MSAALPSPATQLTARSRSSDEDSSWIEEDEDFEEESDEFLDMVEEKIPKEDKLMFVYHGSPIPAQTQFEELLCLDLSYGYTFEGIEKCRKLQSFSMFLFEVGMEQTVGMENLSFSTLFQNHPVLQHLHFYESPLNDTQLEVIGKHLRHLQEVSLIDCDIRSAFWFADSLKAPKCQLWRLDLGANQINDIKALTLALSSNQSLIRLRLAGNPLFTSNDQNLFQLLQTNSTLRYLNINGCRPLVDKPGFFGDLAQNMNEYILSFGFYLSDAIFTEHLARNQDLRVTRFELARLVLMARNAKISGNERFNLIPVDLVRQICWSVCSGGRWMK